MTASGRCFVVVLSRREGAVTAKPLTLTVHSRSIEAFRGAAMKAVKQVQELYADRKPAYQIIAVDMEASPSSAKGTSPYAWQVLRTLIEQDPWWQWLRGRLARTLDVDKILLRVREATAGVVKPDDALVVITNQELTPPPEWRYLLWDTRPSAHNAVLSACQMDPYYWSGDTTGRFATVQARLRAALCASIGELTGLSRCDNDACYMRREVTSVVELDAMTGYGAEHDAGGGQE